MYIEVTSRLRSYRPRRAELEQVARVAGHALRRDSAHATLLLTTDRGIRGLNRRWRRKDRATDVLSFATARMPGNEDVLGDVVISVDTARRQARAEGHSLHTEVAWLFLHGLLHLGGYDHATDQGQMTRLELRLRARLKARA